MFVTRPNNRLSVPRLGDLAQPQDAPLAQQVIPPSPIPKLDIYSVTLCKLGSHQRTPAHNPLCVGEARVSSRRDDVEFGLRLVLTLRNAESSTRSLRVDLTHTVVQAAPQTRERSRVALSPLDISQTPTVVDGRVR